MTTWFDSILDERPAYADAMRAVEGAIADQDQVEPAILELCRRRIALLLGADVDLVAERPVLTERERVCLDYAEQLLIDAQGVSDEKAAGVIDAIGEGGFLVLTYACGFFETVQRARLLP